MHGDKARDDLEWNWSENVLTKGEEKGKNTVAFVLAALLCVQAEASPLWNPRHFDFRTNSTVWI